MNSVSNEWNMLICKTMPKEIRRAYEAYQTMQKAVDSLRDAFEIYFTALEEVQRNRIVELESDSFEF
jgi:uncharacterized NAD(P)/FAD-binding protein YdhS